MSEKLVPIKTGYTWELVLKIALILAGIGIAGLIGGLGVWGAWELIAWMAKPSGVRVD